MVDVTCVVCGNFEFKIGDGITIKDLHAHFFTSNPTCCPQIVEMTEIPVATATLVEQEEKDTKDANVVIAVLENAIETATEEFVIEEVRSEDIAPPVGCCDVIPEFKWPLMALAVVVASAVGVIFYKPLPILYVYFPYYACIINFLGGIPSTTRSLNNMAVAIIPRLAELELRIQRTAKETESKATEGYTSYADYFRERRDAAINGLRPAWMGSSALASNGNQIQSFEISEKDAAAKTDTLEVMGHAVVDEDEDDVDYQKHPEKILRGSKYICLPFQSKELFHFFVTFPIISVLFLMQFTFVWYYQTVFMGMPAHKDDYGNMVIDDRKRFLPLTLSITTFMMVIMQISVAMCLANASRAARILNQKFQERGGNVTDFKQHVATFLILIKKRFVDFVKFLGGLLQIKGYGSNLLDSINGKFTKAIGWKNSKSTSADTEVPSAPPRHELP